MTVRRPSKVSVIPRANHAELRQPLLVVSGTHDHLPTPELARRLADSDRRAAVPAARHPLTAAIRSESVLVVAAWGEMRRAAPEIEATGRPLLYQQGVGLGYLAAIGVDGSQRVHPMCPLLREDGYSPSSFPRLSKGISIVTAALRCISIRARRMSVRRDSLLSGLAASPPPEGMRRPPAPTRTHDGGSLRVDRCSFSPSWSVRCSHLTGA